jgi:hypothetical protein
MTETVTPSAAPPGGSRLDAFKRSLPSRFKAAGIHFGISAVIFAVALYLMLAHWYPGFHFVVDGGWRGVKIMAGVDLVLGPMLTLIVFNRLKSRRAIAFDLSCVAIAQLGALAWGFYAVHSQRPVAVSYYEGAFLSLTAEPLAIEKQPADYANQFSERRPPLVYVQPPANDEEGARAAMQELMGMVGYHEDPFFFRRLDENWGEVRKGAVGAEARGKEKPAFAAALPGFLADHGGAAGDYLYFPYEGHEGSCTLAFKPDGTLVDAIGCEQY